MYRQTAREDRPFSQPVFFVIPAVMINTDHVPHLKEEICEREREREKARRRTKEADGGCRENLRIKRRTVLSGVARQLAASFVGIDGGGDLRRNRRNSLRTQLTLRPLQGVGLHPLLYPPRLVRRSLPLPHHLRYTTAGGTKWQGDCFFE